MSNPHPQPTKWYRMVSRGKHHALFLIDAVGIGNQKSYAKKYYNFSYQPKYYRQFDSSRWISMDDYKKSIAAFRKHIRKDPEYIIELGKRMEAADLEMIKFVDKNKNVNWKKKNNEELSEMIENIADAIARMWAIGWYYGFYFFFSEIYLDEFSKKLEKKLGTNKFQEVWETLINPYKSTFIGKEQLALLKLAKKHAKSKKVPGREIEKHWHEFGFVNKFYFWGDGLTKKEIRSRLADLLKKGPEYINVEIRKIRIPKMNLAKFNLTKRDQAIIKGFTKLNYATNTADGAINYLGFYMRPFFDEIGKRLGVIYEELLSMRVPEILESLRNDKLSVSKKKLSARYKNHALIFDHDKTFVLSGKKLQKYKKLELKGDKIKKIKTLAGVVAYPGDKVEGKIKIIIADEEVRDFTSGKILVTQMTNPSFLPAMKKAVAIVTDEGGMLCHAAIVSREIGVPCIIGTKIATKVLKDGDKVKIDAKKGIINKI